jgi:hypothetical protein
MNGLTVGQGIGATDEARRDSRDGRLSSEKLALVNLKRRSGLEEERERERGGREGQREALFQTGFFL